MNTWPLSLEARRPGLKHRYGVIPNLTEIDH
jgi:hypothetical protein